jgi:hypothetical protein
MPISSHQPAENRYSIYIKGRLNKAAIEWFEECQISESVEGTILSIDIADQAALHGLLAKIRDLGLELLKIERK